MTCDIVFVWISSCSVDKILCIDYYDFFLKFIHESLLLNKDAK